MFGGGGRPDRCAIKSILKQNLHKFDFYTHPRPGIAFCEHVLAQEAQARTAARIAAARFLVFFAQRELSSSSCSR